MIVTRTRVGDHIYKIVSYFIIFLIVGLGINARFLETHCSGRTCSRMIKLASTRHIVYCNDETSRKKAAEPVKI